MSPTRQKINPTFIFIAGLIVIFCAQDLYAGELGARYREAIRCVKLKQPDFAFMGFRSIARDFPDNPLAERAIFAMAEYYYDNKMYYDAIKNFTLCAKDCSDFKANVIAKAYILKIIKEIEDPSLEEKEMFEDIKKEFFSKSLILIFSEYKKTSYRSASLNKFKIKYQTDNVDVYRNDQPFLTLEP